MTDDANPMIPCNLGRLVLVEGQDRQYIFLIEDGGEGRSFPIVIGTGEAHEIHRVLHGDDTPRPLTHQLTHNLMEALDTRMTHVDIIDLRHNTFYAQITVQNPEGDTVAVVDARPSDAIALALRARCGIRVAEKVLEQATHEAEQPPDLGGEESE